MKVAGRQILRPWPKLGFLGLFLIVGIGTADLLTPAPKVGGPPSYVGAIELAGRRIPLPEGSWLQAGLSNDSAGSAETRPYGAIETGGLFKILDGAVDSFITLRANSLPIEGGWGPAVECSREDIHFVSVSHLAAHESLCGFVNHVVTAREARSSPAWSEALRLARVRGWKLPQTWIMAGFRVTDRHDMLDLRYHLNPERGGFPVDRGQWASSAWSRQAVAESPPRKAVVDGLAKWIMEASGPVQQIGAGRRAALLPKLPAIEYADVASTTVQAAEQSAPWGISAGKMGVWAVISNFTSMAINAAFTSAAPVGTGVLSIVQGVTHPIVNYANEMIWETFGAATKPLPPLDFPTAGIAAPGIQPLPLDVPGTDATS